MLSLQGNDFLIESVSELPDVTSTKEIFLDIETQNNSYGTISNKISGMYPWKGDKVGGFSFCVDDDPRHFYVPMRHTRRSSKNLPLDNVYAWLRHATKRDWINHNITFDATFLRCEGVEFGGRLIDTLTLSKIHDSDRMGHGLKDLAREWLGFKMSEVDEVKAYLDGIKSHSYADVPTDIMGRYACRDVETVRALYRMLQAKRPEQLKRVWETEIALTPVLCDMEFEGLKVDPAQLKQELRKSLKLMIQTGDELLERTGREFSNSSDCVFDLLVNQFGLPILMTKKERDDDGHEVDTGRPTFDKDALHLYAVHPAVTADPNIKRVVELIQAYRKESQYKSLFLESFLELKDDNDRVHPRYNQLVRTSRTSCSRPNSQQQNLRSKALIHPEEGMGFMSCDYSQIEYRVIAHYSGDKKIIDAYCDQPDIDFHQWVADLLHVKRKAGKTLNFGMAFGSGKAKVTAGLVKNPDIIEEIGEQINKMISEGRAAPELRIEMFKQLCFTRASEVYEAYHERLPGIKTTSREAARVARSRGFVFNLYGRRRHLPIKFAHKAFNSIVQSTAGDIMKDRMVALSPRYNAKTRALGIRFAWMVHDDLGMHVPRERLLDSETHSYIRETLQSPTIPLSVPIYTGLGVSMKSWAEAASEDEIKDEAGNVVAGCLY